MYLCADALVERQSLRVVGSRDPFYAPIAFGIGERSEVGKQSSPNPFVSVEILDEEIV
jgi:hypothetical protein